MPGHYKQAKTAYWSKNSASFINVETVSPNHVPTLPCKSIQTPRTIFHFLKEQLQTSVHFIGILICCIIVNDTWYIFFTSKNMKNQCAFITTVSTLIPLNKIQFNQLLVEVT